MAPNLFYNADGKWRGHYVYALVCGDSEWIYVKIGISINPLSRLNQLRTACPVVPHTLATAHVKSLEVARRIETCLHDVLKDRRSNGEWFKFTKDDKAEFNARCQRVFESFSDKTSHPVKWEKLNLERYLKQLAQKRRFAFIRAKRRGTAFLDASKHGCRMR